MEFMRWSHRIMDLLKLTNKILLIGIPLDCF